MSRLDNLFNTLQITPHNEQLYEEALTHSSFKTKDEKAKDYERLEFLGDAVINLIITTAIFKSYPLKKQGELTNMRKNFVRTHNLSKLGRQLGLEHFIRTGKSITQEALIKNDKYFEDTFESIIGALYLDQGIDITEQILLGLVGNQIANYDFSQVFDYISTLQEFTQADRRGLPQYETIASGHKEAEKAFISNVSFEGIVLGKGFGANKNEAEQMAAKDALAKVAR